MALTPDTFPLPEDITREVDGLLDSADRLLDATGTRIKSVKPDGQPKEFLAGRCIRSISFPDGSDTELYFDPDEKALLHDGTMPRKLVMHFPLGREIELPADDLPADIAAAIKTTRFSVVHIADYSATPVARLLPNGGSGVVRKHGFQIDATLERGDERLVFPWSGLRGFSIDSMSDPKSNVVRALIVRAVQARVNELFAQVSPDALDTTNGKVVVGADGIVAPTVFGAPGVRIEPGHGLFRVVTVYPGDGEEPIILDGDDRKTQMGE